MRESSSGHPFHSANSQVCGHQKPEFTAQFTVQVIRAQAHMGEGEREMTHRTPCAVLTVFGLSMIVAAPATAQVDVKAYLVPVLSPGDVNPNDVVDSPGVDDCYHLQFDWTSTPNFHVEIWINDLGVLNTGVISAYTDVIWDNGIIADALGLHHESAFSLLAEGAIDDPSSSVNNFGGSNPSFSGQGIAQYVRVGYIDFIATGGGLINFEGAVGAGEYSVFGRSIGDIEIRGAEVRTPEPTSLLLFGAATGACFLRRTRRTQAMMAQ
jgi:hypothetical protein